MLFPTIEFALFFLAVLPCTWLLNQHNAVKKVFLVLASYLFYSFWSVPFLALLFASSVGNYAFGLLIARTETASWRGALVRLAVLGNLAPLCLFKYADFVSVQLQTLSDSLGLSLRLGTTGLAVPIAISFLTFHGISYVVDVYRGRVAATRSLLDLLLYISFFPHLVAGPIVRAAEFLDQLARPSDPRAIDVGRSALLILGGLFKKVVIASQLAILFVDPVFTNPGAYSSLDLILAVYAYAIVIYCDFSAYTDIAIGVADLLGYKFPQNFNQPYFAYSLQEFWHRWHMTLSSWLRDYLYIPLGGSRNGTLRTYRNLILTMVLGGLWHGAGFQFILWGALHGVGLATERFLREASAQTAPWRRFLRSEFGLTLRWLVVFHLVCLGWVFFRSADSASALEFLGLIGRKLGDHAPPAATPLVLALMMTGFLTQLLPLAVYDLASTLYARAHIAAKAAVAASVVWAIVMLAPAGVAPFIYFQF